MTVAAGLTTRGVRSGLASTRALTGCGGTDVLFKPLRRALLFELVPVVAEEQLAILQVAHHLQAVDGRVVVLDAVVEAGRIALQVLFEPDGVLRHDHRLPVGEPDPYRLVAERVARRAEHRDAAVAEQVVIALELEIVEVTRGT